MKNYIKNLTKIVLSYNYNYCNFIFIFIEELIFKLEEDILTNQGEKKVRKFERAPRPNRLSTHVSKKKKKKCQQHD